MVFLPQSLMPLGGFFFGVSNIGETLCGGLCFCGGSQQKWRQVVPKRRDFI
jgi:hypothetical protein